MEKVSEEQLSEELLDLARFLKYLGKDALSTKLISIAFFLERNNLNKIENLKYDLKLK